MIGTLGGALGIGVLGISEFPKPLESAEISDVERANLKIVTAMVGTWDEVAGSDPQDFSRLSPFFSDGCSFRLRPTDQTPTRGQEQVEAAIKRGTANGQKIHHELLDRFAKGPVVVVEKLNHFITPEKTRTSHVVAVFLIKDGKIAEWTEYFISST